MKKKLKVLLVVLIVAFVSFMSLEKQYEINDLAFENIEALARGEDGDVNLRCDGDGPLDCPFTYEKVEFVYDGEGFE